MPRPKTPVKNKTGRNSSKKPGNRRLTKQRPSIGAVDLHFHGAFGIDLMSASSEQMDSLAEQLWAHGVAAFCPTTLSVEKTEFHEAVSRIGAWTRGVWDRIRRGEKPTGAIPLGLHLEGPFISPQACGAHPPSAIRPLDFQEIDALWEKSHKTLKILTIAPEILPEGDLPKLVSWAKKRKIILSLGHSRASEEQANAAFKAGFTNVTHAWNALPFHQRSPGPLGAALGSPKVFLELIVDGAHVSDTVIDWTLRIHSPERVCFVSDCVTAAGLPENGPEVPFGPLRIRFKDGACRLENGALAGGGLLLPESFRRWTARSKSDFSQTTVCMSEAPLQAIQPAPELEKFLRHHRTGSWSATRQGPRFSQKSV